MEFTLSSIPFILSLIFDKVGYRSQGKALNRVEHTKSPIFPINLNSEVMPHVVKERSLEKNVQSVVKDFEEMCVLRHGSIGVEGEGRAQLDTKHMGAVAGLNEYDLILVFIV